MTPFIASLILAASPAIATATADDVLAEVRRPGASAVIVNVWATWCLPCREEFPDLVRVGRDYAARGVRLVFVSTDFGSDREQAGKFLAQHGVPGPSFIKKEGSDMDFIDGIDPRWSGAIPATFVYDGSGRARWFHEGRTDYAALKSKIDEVLATPSAPEEKR